MSLQGKQTVSDLLGATVGRVRGADSRFPIPGANAIVTWLPVIFTNGEIKSTARTELAVTDIEGVYRMCGLPGADALFGVVTIRRRC